LKNKKLIKFASTEFIIASINQFFIFDSNINATDQNKKVIIVIELLVNPLHN